MFVISKKSFNIFTQTSINVHIYSSFLINRSTHSFHGLSFFLCLLRTVTVSTLPSSSSSRASPVQGVCDACVAGTAPWMAGRRLSFSPRDVSFLVLPSSLVTVGATLLTRIRCWAPYVTGYSLYTVVVVLYCGFLRVGV